jgi:hypothetical protein
MLSRQNKCRAGNSLVVNSCPPPLQLHSLQEIGWHDQEADDVCRVAIRNPNARSIITSASNASRLEPRMEHG